MIGVGILGASPDRGWAAMAHLPALAALPEQYRLVAVGTSRAESAREAQRRFGAAHAFTNAEELAGHPEVDLVVVTVKVPAHRELVLAALAAGKHVYCEWPLGRDAAEAKELAQAAEAAGVRAVIGLQGRFSPAAVAARKLIDEGKIGRIRTATLLSARARGGAGGVPAWMAYTFDRANGAGLVEVLGGHAVDLLRHLAGPIRSISSRATLQVREQVIAETGERIEANTPDHLAAVAELDGGALATVLVHDNEQLRPRVRLEIAGTEGTLTLVSAPERQLLAIQPQIGRLELLDAQGEPVPLPGSELPVPAVNVAALYRQLAVDLRTGSRVVPDFRDALELHELLVR
ncbi:MULTISPECIES: Gfo/Idh/MocA family protein [unclassified Crossiella]|uniref:Gfo/Idh/MocA family protein n=1 Tax=unclassified Crossiella TaxID=2620835 RepID=UPI001FFFFDA6|nr:MULTISPECIES: Gfo/Idh/MocA family oxidoreductase [unclassified Crossiella]MCK2242434.1 Gfo/Idh/MocA family oxidoreductase [Crossiella sp. S99.2]MCK2254535.1 Gfo/Idh/MocA family oxidoreductase [Crossiella sp. S99.1]